MSSVGYRSQTCPVVCPPMGIASARAFIATASATQKKRRIARIRSGFIRVLDTTAIVSAVVYTRLPAFPTRVPGFRSPKRRHPARRHGRGAAVTTADAIEPIDLAAYRNIVILTGAGISVASGLSTYRGPGGLWEKADVARIADARNLP